MNLTSRYKKMLFEKHKKTITNAKGKYYSTVQASGSRRYETKVSKHKDMRTKKKQTRREDKQI
ncbi:hypothetical protein ACJMK2_011349, partial [Sinanodonta woodiana]